MKGYAKEEKKLGLPKGTIDAIIRKVILGELKRIIVEDIGPKIADLSVAVAKGEITQQESKRRLREHIDSLAGLGN